jgi:hypothetical protein
VDDLSGTYYSNLSDSRFHVIDTREDKVPIACVDLTFYRYHQYNRAYVVKMLATKDWVPVAQSQESDNE